MGVDFVLPRFDDVDFKKIDLKVEQGRDCVDACFLGCECRRPGRYRLFGCGVSLTLEKSTLALQFIELAASLAYGFSGGSSEVKRVPGKGECSQCRQQRCRNGDRLFAAE